MSLRFACSILHNAQLCDEWAVRKQRLLIKLKSAATHRITPAIRQAQIPALREHRIAAHCTK